MRCNYLFLLWETLILRYELFPRGSGVQIWAGKWVEPSWLPVSELTLKHKARGPRGGAGRPAARCTTATLLAEHHRERKRERAHTDTSHWYQHTVYSCQLIHNSENITTPTLWNQGPQTHRSRGPLQKKQNIYSQNVIWLLVDFHFCVCFVHSYIWKLVFPPSHF